MNLLFALLIILVLLVSIIIAILKRAVALSEAAFARFLDSLWARRNIIPLFLESISLSGAQATKKTVIIETRARASSSAFTMEEMLQSEKILSTLLTETVKLYDKQAESSALYHAMKVKLDERNKVIGLAWGELNNQKQKWLLLGKLPWFKAFQWVFRQSAMPVPEVI